MVKAALRMLMLVAVVAGLGALAGGRGEAQPAAVVGPALSGQDYTYYLPLAPRVPMPLIAGSVAVGGIQREYLLYFPGTYDGRSPAPLILNYHAFNRDGHTQLAYGDFRKVAEQSGAIIALPQGLILDGIRRWNVGGIYTHPLADDVGFTEALIDALSATYNADPTRVYVTGFSNGAYMSYLVACQLSERIAAVAAVAGSMMPDMLAECRPSRPLPVLHVHGLDDGVVLYGGDAGSVAVEEVIAYWAANNHSRPTAVIYQLPDTDPADGSTVSHVIYEAGEGGVSTELLRVDGGGHTWPGSAAGEAGTNRDIDASAEIWKFFARYDINGLRASGDLQPAKLNQ